MKPIKKFQIGKKGLTPEFVEQVRKCFERREIIKISILSSVCKNKKDAQDISDKLEKELGEKFTSKIIGHTLNVRKWRKNKR